MRTLAISIFVLLGVSTANARTPLPSLTCKQNDAVGLQSFRLPTDIDIDKIFSGDTPPTTLAITVDAAGNFIEIKVESSSLVRALDRSAIDAVRHSHLSGNCLADADGTLYIRYRFDDSSRPVLPYIWRQTTWHEKQPTQLKN